jgi:hypothetical protein
MWIGTGIAVSLAIYLTGVPECLWAFLAPTIATCNMK